MVKSSSLADGIVRVATVRVGSNVYKRNVRLLAPLPIEISAINHSTNELSTEQLRENNHDSSTLTTVRNNWSDRLRSKAGENGVPKTLATSVVSGPAIEAVGMFPP